MPVIPSSSEHRNALPPGHKLGEYQIIEVLGGGGFGITYLAEDVNLSSKFAIKEYFPAEFAWRETGYSVHPQSSSQTEFFERGLDWFIEEAKTLAKFKHPNVVRVARFFRAHNTAYIVMDYEEGQTLASLLTGETATETEIRTILNPILDGLGVVHGAGYYHRDIKPGNIYLRAKSYEPVLIDFGAARYELGGHSRTITSIVTPGYAALEQYSGTTKQGAYTDIYGLGAVLYRLISGQIPAEASERAHALTQGEPDPLKPATEIGKGRYSSKLLEASEWALNVSDKQRPQSIQEGKQKRDNAAIPSPPLYPPKKRNSSRVLVGISLFLISIVGYFGWSYYTNLKDRQDYEQQTEIARQQSQEEQKRLKELEQARQEREQQTAIARQQVQEEQERLRALENERRRHEQQAAMARQQAQEEQERLRALEQARLERERQADIARQQAQEEQERKEALSSRNQSEKMAALQLVRDYYHAITANDSNSVIQKWHNPNRSRLRNLVANAEWCRIDSIDLNYISNLFSNAIVFSDVTCKEKEGTPRQWSVEIELEKYGQDWKIIKLGFR